MNKNYTYYASKEFSENAWIQETFLWKNSFELYNDLNILNSVESIKKYLWPGKSGKKHVINDFGIHSKTAIGNLQEVIGWKYRCYQMVPSEPAFTPRWVFTKFCTGISKRLQKSMQKLEEMGAYVLFEKGRDFFAEIGRQRLRKKTNETDFDWNCRWKAATKELYDGFKKLLCCNCD